MPTASGDPSSQHWRVQTRTATEDGVWITRAHPVSWMEAIQEAERYRSVLGVEARVLLGREIYYWTAATAATPPACLSEVASAGEGGSRDS